MRVVDGRRHEFRRLVAGVTKHHPLVPGPLLFVVVHPAGDVLALAFDGHHHTAGVPVEAHRAFGVANADDGAADNFRDVDVADCADLAGHHAQPGLHQRLDGDPPVDVLGDDGVEHAVANLVCDFVRVTFGHGLRGEEEVLRHG